MFTLTSRSLNFRTLAERADTPRLSNVPVVVESVNQIPPIASFQDAGLHPAILYNCEKLGYVRPTPIQAYAIAAILLGFDIVGIAQTGKSMVQVHTQTQLTQL